jgi:hypothetical protein
MIASTFGVPNHRTGVVLCWERNGSREPLTVLYCRGLDFTDGAGRGGSEVFGGGEVLAVLGGPFSHGERGSDAAQGDFDRDIVAADD